MDPEPLGSQQASRKQGGVLGSKDTSGNSSGLVLFSLYATPMFERTQNWNSEDLHFNPTKPDYLQASQDANVLIWKSMGEGRNVLKSIYGPILLEHFLNELSGA